MGLAEKSNRSPNQGNSDTSVSEITNAEGVTLTSRVIIENLMIDIVLGVG